METRVLVLNPDPVFEDQTLDVLEELPGVSLKMVRNLGETVSILIAEDFDGLIVEGEAAAALDKATNARQHFPSLSILCIAWTKPSREMIADASQQKITFTTRSTKLRRELQSFVGKLDRRSGVAAEGIDPCHSLIGNLNQFSAAEILQMSCLSQRSGRFTFKSGRGNSEIYLQHGCVRHAIYDGLAGEAAVAEIFRWREGRFYFEEGIISQIETVDRPWAHLLIDNLQKLDETLDLAAQSHRQ